MECLTKPADRKDPDADLIMNIHSSSINRRRAEEQLFTRYAYFIRLGQKKYSLATEDLFDAYSDAILAVIHNLSSDLFQRKSTLKTFIFGIFHHKCVDIIRKNTTTKNLINKTESLAPLHTYLTDSTMPVIEKLMLLSDIEIIKQKMELLGGNCKKLLLLSADGYTDKEIAVMIGFKNADVAKTCRLRSMKRLKQLLC